MKTDKLKKRMLIPAAGLLLLAGCTADDHEADTGPTEVRFAASVTDALPQTRMAGDAWETDDGIGVFMLSGGGNLPGGISTVGGKTADNRKFVYGGSAFAPAAGEAIYYPQTGTVDFIAYYPYKPTGSGGLDNYLYPVDVSNQGVPAAIDVLYSDNAAGRSRSKSAVPMTFTHALSKLELTIVKGTGMASEDFTGMTVVIKGMPATAKLALTDGQTFSGAASADLVPRTITAGASYEAILIPQSQDGGTTSGLPNFNGRTAVFTIGGQDYTWPIPDNAAFAQGTRNAYTLTVNRNGITASAGTITDWTGKDEQPTTGGTTSDHRYAVGDVYPYIGTPQGIVYWLDTAAAGYDDSGAEPIGLHGKIVSLDEGTSLRWDQNDGGTGAGYYNTGATNETDGLANMVEVQGFISSNGKNWGQHFPAFGWCDSKNGAGSTTYASGATGVWYLPAKDELSALYTAWNDNRTTFNGWLTAAGGTDLAGYFYWSSTECIDLDAWGVAFYSGSTNYDDKYNLSRVRAVLAF